jgi:hypothetical protein
MWRQQIALKIFQKNNFIRKIYYVPSIVSLNHSHIQFGSFKADCIRHLSSKKSSKNKNNKDLSHFDDFDLETEKSSSEITALDRLLRMKPAIVKDFDDFENDPRPFMNDPDGEYNYEKAHADEIETDEVDPRNKLSRKLLSLSRVYYRHIESLPNWFEEKQSEITKNRTPAQIRRCLSNWMVRFFYFPSTYNSNFTLFSPFIY